MNTNNETLNPLAINYHEYQVATYRSLGLSNFEAEAKADADLLDWIDPSSLFEDSSADEEWDVLVNS